MSAFSENCAEYRCCCECCHVKTATGIIAAIESGLLGYFMINSVVLIVTDDGKGGGLVVGPFAAAMVGFVFGVFVLCLLVIGLRKKIPCLLLPHLVVQILSLFLLLGVIIVGIVALSTNLTVFYRLMNSVAFEMHGEGDTVNLGAYQHVPLIVCLTMYSLAFLLELWFCLVVYWCYKYLCERADYVKYIEQYSMPLHAAPNKQTIPVPTYYHGNTTYMTAKRASE